MRFQVMRPECPDLSWVRGTDETGKSRAARVPVSRTPKRFGVTWGDALSSENVGARRLSSANKKVPAA